MCSVTLGGQLKVDQTINMGHHEKKKTADVASSGSSSEPMTRSYNARNIS